MIIIPHFSVFGVPFDPDYDRPYPQTTLVPQALPAGEVGPKRLGYSVKLLLSKMLPFFCFHDIHNTDGTKARHYRNCS